MNWAQAERGNRSDYPVIGMQRENYLAAAGSLHRSCRGSTQLPGRVSRPEVQLLSRKEKGRTASVLHSQQHLVCSDCFVEASHPVHTECCLNVVSIHSWMSLV